MNDGEPDRIQRLSIRLTQVEELSAHFERALESLDEATRQLHERLDTLERSVDGLMARVARAGADEGPIEDERPPHY